MTDILLTITEQIVTCNITSGPDTITGSITVSSAPTADKSAVSITVSQTGHALSVGNVLRRGSGSYVKALADSAENAEVIGIVSYVYGVNSFELTLDGYVSGLSGLTERAVYFLSDTVAGALTTTVPVTQLHVIKPLLSAVSTTAGMFENMRGIEVPSNTAGADAIYQVGHTLAQGDCIRYNGSSYVGALADTENNAQIIGMVSAVYDADNFAIVMVGKVSFLSGLTPGSIYYLSPTLTGKMTLTQPSTSGQVEKPILIATTTTAGYFVNMRGTVIP
jgi:hypothetical protein